MRLDGQVAIVTGAGSGLGRAIALALAEEGAAVVLAGRDAHALGKVATTVDQLGRETMVVACDVREPAQVRELVGRTVAEWSTVNILVNSAGVAVRRPVIDTDPDAWDAVVDTLLKGTFLMIQAVLPSMIAARRGNIINLAAPLEHIAVSGFAAYTAAKYGVVGLTRTLARELRQYGINVNAIHPGGYADTPMVRKAVPELKQGLLDPAVVTPVAVALALQPPRGLTGDIIDARAWNTDDGLGAGLG